MWMIFSETSSTEAPRPARDPALCPRVYLTVRHAPDDPINLGEKTSLSRSIRTFSHLRLVLRRSKITTTPIARTGRCVRTRRLP